MKINRMKFVGIIPARYQSTRFPGKPLALINGKPMILHVTGQAVKALEQVWVATDNEEIFNTVTTAGGNAIMTSSAHQSGTDRCAEAAKILSDRISFDVVINIQGDEPFIQPGQIRQLMDCFDEGTEIATLIREISDQAELENPNKPKVVTGVGGNALYFSRSVIPCIRGASVSEWLSRHTFWAHIGMYGYRKDVLQQITLLSPSLLEKAESLEQLRWLENGYRIRTAVTRFPSFGIDTPEDLGFALKNFTFPAG